MHLWKYGVFGEDIENMETDLSDCIALTALYAMIKEGTAFPVASLFVFSTLAILMSVGHLSEFVGQAERERKGFSEQDGLGEGKSLNFLKGNLLNDRKSFRTSLPWTKLTKIWEACNSATVCWRCHRLKGWRVVLYLLPPIQLHWPAFVQGKELVGSTWNCWRHPQQHVQPTNQWNWWLLLLKIIFFGASEWSACPFARWHWEVANFLGCWFCLASNASGETSQMTQL